MGGNKKNIHGMSLGLGGALTLEKMDLDRREEFQGDAFNPFGNSSKKIDTKL